MNRPTRFRNASALVLALTACGSQPLPSDKASYSGTWRGDGVNLVITQDGGVSYRRVSGSGEVTVNGPLREFDGDDFIVGIPVVNTTFDVTVAPHEEGGAWKMTVDGVELTKVSQ